MAEETGVGVGAPDASIIFGVDARAPIEAFNLLEKKIRKFKALSPVGIRFAADIPGLETQMGEAQSLLSASKLVAPVTLKLVEGSVMAIKTEVQAALAASPVTVPVVLQPVQGAGATSLASIAASSPAAQQIARQAESRASAAIRAMANVSGPTPEARINEFMRRVGNVHGVKIFDGDVEGPTLMAKQRGGKRAARNAARIAEENRIASEELRRRAEIWGDTNAPYLNRPVTATGLPYRPSKYTSASTFNTPPVVTTGPVTYGPMNPFQYASPIGPSRGMIRSGWGGYSYSGQQFSPYNSSPAIPAMAGLRSPSLMNRLGEPPSPPAGPPKTPWYKDAWSRINSGPSTEQVIANRRLQEEARREFFAGNTLLRNITAPALLVGGGTAFMSSRLQTQMAHIEGLTQQSRGMTNWMKGGMIDATLNDNIGAEDRASALYEVSSTGYKGADAMKILASATKGAAAGLGEAKEVASLSTTILSAYGQEASKAARNTDILTQMVVFGKGEASEYAAALGKVVPMASMAGVNLEELGASLATMTRVGIKPAEGATALNQLLTHMVAPTNQAKEQLKTLGYAPGDIRNMIKTSGLNATLGNIYASATKGGSTGIESFEDLFGNVRGLKGFLSTTATQPETYKEGLDAMRNSAGATERALAAVADTTEFQFGRTVNAIKRSAYAIGDTILPWLTKKFEGFADSAPRSFDRISNSWQDLGEVPGGGIAQAGIGIGAAGLALAGPLMYSSALIKDVRSSQMFRRLTGGPMSMTSRLGYAGGAALGARYLDSNFGLLGGATDGAADFMTSDMGNIATAGGIGLYAAAQYGKPFGAWAGARYTGMTGGIANSYRALMASRAAPGVTSAAGRAALGLPPLLGSRAAGVGAAMFGTSAGVGGMALGPLAFTAAMLGGTAYYSRENSLTQRSLQSMNIKDSTQDVMKTLDSSLGVTDGNLKLTQRVDELREKIINAGQDTLQLGSALRDIDKISLGVKSGKIEMDPLSRQLFLDDFEKLKRQTQKLIVEVDVKPLNSYESWMQDLEAGAGEAGKRLQYLWRDDYRKRVEGQQARDEAVKNSPGFNTPTSNISPFARGLKKEVDSRKPADTRSEFVKSLKTTLSNPNSVEAIFSRITGLESSTGEDLSGRIEGWDVNDPNARAILNKAVSALKSNPSLAKGSFSPIARSLRSRLAEFNRSRPLEDTSSDEDANRQAEANSLRSQAEALATQRDSYSEAKSAIDTFSGAVDNTIARLNEFADKSEEARMESAMLKRGVDGVSDSFKSQAVELAGYIDKLSNLRAGHATLKGIVGGIESSLVEAGGNPMALNGMMKSLNDILPFTSNIKGLQSEALLKGKELASAAESESDRLAQSMKDLGAEIKALNDTIASMESRRSSGSVSGSGGDASYNPKGSKGFGGVKSHVAESGNRVSEQFGINDIDGVGSRGNASDHPRGLALDFMTRNNKGKGNDIASYFQKNAASENVGYIIWDDKIWSPGRSKEGWRPYVHPNLKGAKNLSSRKHDTLQHRDHVHVSYKSSPSGIKPIKGVTPSHDHAGHSHDEEPPRARPVEYVSKRGKAFVSSPKKTAKRAVGQYEFTQEPMAFRGPEYQLASYNNNWLKMLPEGFAQFGGFDPKRPNAKNLQLAVMNSKTQSDMAKAITELRMRDYKGPKEDRANVFANMHASLMKGGNGAIQKSLVALAQGADVSDNYLGTKIANDAFYGEQLAARSDLISARYKDDPTAAFNYNLFNDTRSPLTPNQKRWLMDMNRNSLSLKARNSNSDIMSGLHREGGIGGRRLGGLLSTGYAEGGSYLADESGFRSQAQLDMRSQVALLGQGEVDAEVSRRVRRSMKNRANDLAFNYRSDQANRNRQYGYDLEDVGIDNYNAVFGKRERDSAISSAGRNAYRSGFDSSMSYNLSMGKDYDTARKLAEAEGLLQKERAEGLETTRQSTLSLRGFHQTMEDLGNAGVVGRDSNNFFGIARNRNLSDTEFNSQINAGLRSSMYSMQDKFAESFSGVGTRSQSQAMANMIDLLESRRGETLERMRQGAADANLPFDEGRANAAIQADIDSRTGQLAYQKRLEEVQAIAESEMSMKDSIVARNEEMLSLLALTKEQKVAVAIIKATNAAARKGITKESNLEAYEKIREDAAKEELARIKQEKEMQAAQYKVATISAFTDASGSAIDAVLAGKNPQNEINARQEQYRWLSMKMDLRDAGFGKDSREYKMAERQFNKLQSQQPDDSTFGRAKEAFGETLGTNIKKITGDALKRTANDFLTPIIGNILGISTPDINGQNAAISAQIANITAQSVNLTATNVMVNGSGGAQAASGMAGTFSGGMTPEQAVFQGLSPVLGALINGRV